MNGGVAMDSHWGIDPADEARHREMMAAVGVYDADWALCKVVEASDIKTNQNRLQLTKDMVRGGPIPRLFPEVEEIGDDGLNAQRTVSVALLDAEGREKKVILGYLNSNTSYRIRGPEWKLFVRESGICNGDRLDLYACKRGDGERCLFSFTSKGGGGSAWCTNRRKRAQQPAAAAAAVRDHKRRPKSRRAKREGHTGYVLDDACTGDFQGGYGCFMAAERTMEAKDPRSWKDSAAKTEREAAKGLLMLKYAILAEYYY